jgi:hypothetical protein
LVTLALAMEVDISKLFEFKDWSWKMRCADYHGIYAYFGGVGMCLGFYEQVGNN